MTANDIITRADILNETDRLMLADHLADLGRDEEAELLRAGPVILAERGEFLPRPEGELCASDYSAWGDGGLKDFGDFGDAVEYRNQTEYGDGTLSGDWFYPDEYNRVIYWGTFSDSHSPGASHFTYADVHDTDESFRDALQAWEQAPEYEEED